MAASFFLNGSWRLKMNDHESLREIRYAVPSLRDADFVLQYAQTLDDVAKIIESSQNDNRQYTDWKVFQIALLAEEMAQINSFLVEEINNRLTHENLRDGEWGTSEEMGDMLRRSQEIAEEVGVLARSLTEKISPRDS